jgi:hypothetical protein
VKVEPLATFFALSELESFIYSSENPRSYFKSPYTQVLNSSSKNLNHLIAGMRVNMSKSKFFAEQIKSLSVGYWITRQGIQPIRNKVEVNAILNIKALKTRYLFRNTPVY